MGQALIRVSHKTKGSINPDDPALSFNYFYLYYDNNSTTVIILK